jgi:hypothetical protein
VSGGAAIFFARDFLATEFPSFARALGDRPRVYIVMNQTEAAIASAGDRCGEVIIAGSVPRSPAPIDDGDAVARDRTLRFASPSEIAEVRRATADVCEYVLARYPKPSFYFDEPVSGYANEVFNRRFRAAGALGLHFHSTWVPGYMFFVSDMGQELPVPLGVLNTGRTLIADHLERRASGGALPHYVLSYGKIGRRLKDIALNSAKGLYRKFMRQGANYVDRDPEAHRLHASALRLSLTGRYSSDPAEEMEGDGKLVIFPLHYEPEALLTYFSPFYRQEEIAARLLDSLPADWRLVLKEHPSQPGALHLPKWRDLVRAGRVIALPGAYPASRLLARKPIVVSLGSTFALEAALAGCPTGVLGTVHFRDAPGVTRLDRPEDWSLLAGRAAAPSGDIAAWYAGFLDRYAFAGNIMRGKTWIDQPEALGRALARAAGEKA